MSTPEDPDAPDNVVSLFQQPRSRPAPDNQDPRQSKTRKILDNIQSSTGADIITPNTATGFSASAPDLGRLQDLLEQPLQHLDMEQLRGRWDDDLAPFASRTILQWVHRVKQLNFEVRETGVHVRMQTQDDRGYYDFGFDIFPGRR